MDRGSFAIAIITFGLFVAAIFFKGWSHDVFLEVGVFLVSVKIIMMAYKNSVALSDLGEKLDTALTELGRVADAGQRAAGDSPQRTDH